MATHDNPSFGRDKVAPGAAYIKSPEYKTRFGKNKGVWLVVTIDSKTRIKNLMRQTRKNSVEEDGLFFFTYFGQISSNDVLMDDIWFQIGRKEPISLFR